MSDEARVGEGENNFTVYFNDMQIAHCIDAEAAAEIVRRWNAARPVEGPAILRAEIAAKDARIAELEAAILKMTGVDYD